VTSSLFRVLFLPHSLLASPSVFQTPSSLPPSHVFFVSNSTSVLLGSIVLNNTAKYRHSEGDKPVMKYCAGIPALSISWNN